MSCDATVSKRFEHSYGPRSVGRDAGGAPAWVRSASGGTSARACADVHSGGSATASHPMTQTTARPTLTIESADPVGDTARELIHALCSEMGERYGTPPSPFSPAEAAAPRSVFLLARLDGHPVGCGALRWFDDHTAEIKRMYVAPAGRRRGIARRLLVELERHAQAFGYQAIRLETGIRQPEAQRLYEALGYRGIAAFGPYAGNPTSVCYEKAIHGA